MSNINMPIQQLDDAYRALVKSTSDSLYLADENDIFSSFDLIKLLINLKIDGIKKIVVLFLLKEPSHLPAC